jgi:hypothetical protein
MFTDTTRARIHDDLRHHDQALFAHLLTPDLFFQAAKLCGLAIVRSPLNLINLVWLAISAARNPDKSFAALLSLPLETLQDHEGFASSTLAQRIDQANKQRRRKAKRHDPRGGTPECISPAAFAKARQHMPVEFWVALFFLLGEQFQRLHGEVLRWQGFRLLAADGTRLSLPDCPALRNHFGTAKNSGGSHNAQAQLVLLEFPLARLPYAYALEPVKTGEVTLARRLLQGLRSDDLVLLDAGFLSYGLLTQIDQQDAHFVVRLHQRLNLRTVKQLGSANDVLVNWQPSDSRGQWRKEKLPPSLELRLLKYQRPGFRPLHLLTNVLSQRKVSREQFWGLTISKEGEVLSRGVYHWRWEIETSYRELKVEQKLDGGLRSRTPEGIDYEVAGHILYYLLVRWLLVEAAQEAGVSPLRLSFKEALGEIQVVWPSSLSASEQWLEEELRPRLLERMAGHRVPERAGRQYPRSKKDRRASKRRASARAKKAQARRKQKVKPRRWYGQGWDLSGPKAEPGATAQG